MESVELPHLSVGSPILVTAPGVSQMGQGIGLKAARRVESRRNLAGERLIMDEAVRPGGATGLLVELFGVEMAPVEAGDLRADQRGAAREVLRAVVSPVLELAMVGGQGIPATGSLRRGGRLAERGLRKRSV